MRTNVITGALALSVCLVASSFALEHASKSERIPPRAPLAEFPMRLGDAWRGEGNEDLDSKTLAVLGVDEYLNRSYRSNGGPPVGLFIGYYESQRQGDAMHSPMNCLPGAGWLPVKSGYATLPLAANTGGQTQTGTPAIEVNRYIVEKGGQSILVFYWYQGHGRVVASEYWGKFYMVLDALRTNRTDAAIVRVIVPIAGSGSGASEENAERIGVDFVRAMFPMLEHHLPA